MSPVVRIGAGILSRLFLRVCEVEESEGEDVLLRKGGGDKGGELRKDEKR